MTAQLQPCWAERRLVPFLNLIYRAVQRWEGRPPERARTQPTGNVINCSWRPPYVSAHVCSQTHLWGMCSGYWPVSLLIFVPATICSEPQCECACVRVCVCVCLYLFSVYVCACTCVLVPMCVCVCMFVCLWKMCAWEKVFVFVWVQASMHVFVCAMRLIKTPQGAWFSENPPAQEITTHPIAMATRDKQAYQPMFFITQQ